MVDLHVIVVNCDLIHAEENCLKSIKSRRSTTQNRMLKAS